MQLPDSITPEGHAALIECIKFFAARGRALRLEREQKTKPVEMLGSDATGLAEARGTPLLPKGSTDA